MTPEQRRALEMLADNPPGLTESMLMAHGFTIGMLAGLVLAGLATATSSTVQAGRRNIEVVRVRITNAGIQALDDG